MLLTLKPDDFGCTINISFWAWQTRVNEYKEHTRMQDVCVIAVLLKVVVSGSYKERAEKYNYYHEVATTKTNPIAFVIFDKKLINERNKSK